MATNVCSRCGVGTNLGLINCRHTTVCLSCAKPMAEAKEACSVCGVVFTRLLIEYPVRHCSDDEKKYFIGSFPEDFPNFASDQKWSLTKQSESCYANTIDSEVLKKDPWILEDEKGIKYKGSLDAPSDSSAYFFLMREDDGSFVLYPCADRFSFQRVPPGTQLTTEQAEEKINQCRQQADKRIRECRKRWRTGQIKPTSTGGEEDEDSMEKGEHWDHERSSSDDEDVGDSESIPAPEAIREFQEKDNEAFLSNPGRDLNNILRMVKASEKNVEESGSSSGEEEEG